MTIATARTRLLLAALKRLRVWESQAANLFYGDHRTALARLPDNEMPADYIAERERLERDVVRMAALAGGATDDEAETYADTPRASHNPYNVERARFAASLASWRL